MLKGRITGQLLPTYTYTLFEALAKDPTINVNDALLQVSAGVEYLHKLGLCHNDIHVKNIMIDNDGLAVLIDVEFARPGGEQVTVLGNVSSRRNDYEEMERITRELRVGKNKK